MISTISWNYFLSQNYFQSFLSNYFLVLSWWALVWLMHSRAGCQYHQQAINSSQYHCLPLSSWSSSLLLSKPNQTKHTKLGDQLAASNPIINTPRLDNTRPAKNYEYSSSLISAETNRVLADKEMHKTPNPDISISRDQKKIHNFLILHGHRICTNKMQKGVKEGLGLSILPRPD